MGPPGEVGLWKHIYIAHNNSHWLVRWDRPERLGSGNIYISHTTTLIGWLGGTDRRGWALETYIYRTQQLYAHFRMHQRRRRLLSLHDCRHSNFASVLHHLLYEQKQRWRRSLAGSPGTAAHQDQDQAQDFTTALFATSFQLFPPLPCWNLKEATRLRECRKRA